MKPNLTVLMLVMLTATSIYAQEVAPLQPVAQPPMTTPDVTPAPELTTEVAPEITSDTQVHQPLEPGFVPYQGEVNVRTSYSYSSGSGSYLPNQHSTQSCLTLLRQQEGGGYLETESAINKSANRQTTAGAIVGSSAAVAAGVGAGLLTANPLVGAGVGGAYLLVTAIGTEMTKARIKKNGNTVAAAEKILTGQQLSKKERKAFEKTRKKVSRKAYGNKQVLDNADFAQTVLSQSGTGEKLFCDIDKHGRVRVIAQSKTTIKRLELAQKCKDSTRGGVATRRQVSSQR